MDKIVEEGQVLAPEFWAAIEQEIETRPEKELIDGFIVMGEPRNFFVVKKMKVNEEFVRIIPTLTADEAENKLADLKILDEAPGGVSRATGYFCPDRVWLIENGKVIEPATNEARDFNAELAGKVIVAHNGMMGPFFVIIPNTDQGDGNFDCAGFAFVDDAIDFLDNKRWEDEDYMKRHSSPEVEQNV